MARRPAISVSFPPRLESHAELCSRSHSVEPAAGGQGPKLDKAQVLEGLPVRDPATLTDPVRPAADVPAYPILLPIRVPDFGRLRAAIGQGSSSDHNPASLYAWDLDEDSGVGRLGGHVVIRMRDYLTRRPVLSTPAAQCADWTDLRQLVDLAVEHGFEGLSLVPCDAFAAWGAPPADLEIEDQLHHGDYLYETTTTAGLYGRAFARKRNSIHRIEHDGAIRFCNMDLRSDQALAACEAVSGHWAASGTLSAEAAVAETAALRRFLAAGPAMEMMTFGVFRDQTLIAFSILERVGVTRALCHFTKTREKVRGLSDYLFWSVSKSLAEAGVTSLNYEQDLGDLGLRAYKQSWRPSGQVRKCSVRRRQR